MAIKITRRQSLLLCAAPLLAQAPPKVAITMDDVRWQDIPEDRRPQAEDRLLNSLGKTRAFLFAIGQCVDNEHGAGIVKRWSAAGHSIGNHTYTHQLLSGKTTPEEFEAGILHTENVLRLFLARHGYQSGAVTIDASDWYYNQRLLKRIETDRSFDPTRYRQPYLDHIRDRAQFYDKLSRDVLGRSVPHTLLIHYNLLNSLFLGDLLAMFRSMGWLIIDAEEAFSDEVFTRQPNIAPAGESLIWALAKETGKFEDRLRHPGEDDTYEKPLLDQLGL